MFVKTVPEFHQIMSNKRSKIEISRGACTQPPLVCHMLCTLKPCHVCGGRDCVVNGSSVQRPGNKPSLLNFIDFSWEMITFTITIIVSVWDGGVQIMWEYVSSVHRFCLVWALVWAGSNYHISLLASPFFKC